jgi:hypothetical protein
MPVNGLRPQQEDTFSAGHTLLYQSNQLTCHASRTSGNRSNVTLVTRHQEDRSMCLTIAYYGNSQNIILETHDGLKTTQIIAEILSPKAFH